MHAGLPKTGTTTIQAALRGASSQELNGKKYVGSLCCVGTTGFRKPPPPIANRTLRQVERAGDLIMSSENILGNMNTGYDSAASRAQELFDFFGSATDLQLVVYLRPQVSWVESLCIQFIKMGAVGTSKQLASNILSSRTLQFSTLANELISVVGANNLVIRAYDPKNDVLSDFDYICETALATQTRKGEQHNVSLSAAQALLLERINRRGTRSMSRNARFLLESQDAARSMPDPYSILPEALQRDLNAIEQKDWTELAKHLRSTRYPQVEAFEAVAQRARTWRPRPYVGEVCESGPDSEEATLLLLAAMHAGETSIFRQRQKSKLQWYRSSRPSHLRRSLLCRISSLL